MSVNLGITDGVHKLEGLKVDKVFNDATVEVVMNAEVMIVRYKQRNGVYTGPLASIIVIYLPYHQQHHRHLRILLASHKRSFMTIDVF